MADNAEIDEIVWRRCQWCDCVFITWINRPERYCSRCRRIYEGIKND